MKHKISKKKVKIHQNVWDNWNGYVGNKKVIEFGLDEYKAREWLNENKIQNK
jgi:hypothetical protein